MEFHRQEPMLEEDGDDVFYDELRRQVLQLTADDDGGEDVYETKIMLEGRKRGPHPGASYPICYHGWPGIEEDCAAAATPAPAWMVNLWRSANGTGVFIPQGVQTPRRNRSRRKNGKERRNDEKGRTNRQFVRVN